MCARGAQFFQNPGNIVFRDIVSRYLPSYEAASSKMQKSAIVQDIIREVRCSSSDTTSHFLRMDASVDLWFALTPAAVRQKVGQTLRELKTSLDPEKRDALAERRSRNHKARQERRRMFKATGESSRSLGSLSSAPFSLTLELKEGILPRLIRTQSLPIHQTKFTIPPLNLSCRVKSESNVASPRKRSLTPEEVALATLPLICSSDWFDVPSLSSEDADLTDSVGTVFDDDLDVLDYCTL